MKFWIFTLLLGYSSCSERLQYPENAADISSINNLEYKTPITLDPRIRKALLNVLNRLEQQENEKIVKTEIVNNDTNPIHFFNVNDPPNNVKWEYKVNDTFKEYNYYKTDSDESDKKFISSVNDDKIINDEPGALFFQIPESQEAFEKHESLNLQETKNALSNADLLSANFQKETEKPKLELPKSVINETTKRNEISAKDVEVFQAPLLTAFTLEHDERGLPQRIIPLELSTRSVYQDIRRAREQQTPLIHNPINIDPLFQEQQKRIRFELDSQFNELQERKRQIELEKDRLFAEQEKANRLKFSLEQRQKEQEYLRALNQNEIIRPEIALQKSIEPQFAFNLFNRNPAVLQQFSVPAFSKTIPQINFPDAVDRQLQHLFQRSGLSQGRHEDLNIVSKILALNHEGDEEKSKNQAEFNQERNNDLKNSDLQSRRIIGLRTEQAELYPQYVRLRN